MAEEEVVEKTAETKEANRQGESEESLTRQLLEQTQQELAETKDRYLRALADLANLKKRMAQENQEAWERGMISVIEGLLPILDNFERALAALEHADSVASVRDGVTLIHNQLRAALESRGVQPIEALGQQFDPFWHEAAGKVPSAEAEEGSVVHEIRRGYRIGDRVVRPSRVTVAIRPEESETNPTCDD